VATTFDSIGQNARRGFSVPRYAVLALIVAAAFVVRLPYFGDSAPDYDEQLYSLVGQKMLDGALPYVDLWDRKPFGLFALFALIHVFGSSALVYQLTAAFSAAAGALMVYVLGNRLSGSFAAAIAALTYLVCLPLFGVAIGQSEVFYIPLTLAMLWLHLEAARDPASRRSFGLLSLSMLLGGITLQIKYTVAPQCLFFGALAVVQMWMAKMPPLHALARTALFGTLGLLPTALVAGFYAWRGHFNEFVFANFSSIFLRGKLEGVLASNYGLWVVLNAIPLALLAGIALHRVVAQPRGDRPVGYFIVLGWCLAALIGLLLIGNVYVHYFAPVMPGLLLLAGPLLQSPGMGRRLALVLLAISAAGANFPFQIEHSQSNRTAITRLTKAAAPYIGSQSDCLYVFDGPTALYATTKSCLPTRYVYPDHLSNSMEDGAIGADSVTEVKRILATRPAVIVTASRPIVPRYNPRTAALVNAAVREDYVRVEKAYFFPRLLYINVRKDLAGATRQVPVR
jgi:4-amino-4-deoxy-L-arabinose transferase-like glycosyltransferase